MYKDRKRSVLQRRRTEEQLQQWQRYYGAKLQAAQLRNTLTEVARLYFYLSYKYRIVGHNYVRSYYVE